jgi:hypothetical protein
MTNEQPSNAPTVLGQKYAYATAALLAGIAGYIQMLGIEKAILAIVLAWLALRAEPTPRLQDRRLWAKTALVLGVLYLTILPAVIIWKFESFKQLIATLEKLQ